MKAAPYGLALFNGPRSTPPIVGVSNLVIDAMGLKWSNLEPLEGRYNWTAVDKALAYAEANGFMCDLRVYAGVHSPDWLKARVGSFPYVDSTDSKSGTLPKFWDDQFLYAWESLQRALGARYDNHPLIASVTHSAPMTQYTEPFMRGINAGSNLTNFRANGYTFAADMAAHFRAVSIHKSCWPQTRLRLNLNPWQDPEANKAYVEPLREIILAAGSHAILQNNSIRWVNGGPLTGQYPALYQLMRDQAQAGRPVGFQTADTSRIGDAEATVAWALEQGAQWLEVAADFYTNQAPLVPHLAAMLSLRGKAREAIETATRGLVLEMNENTRLAGSLRQAEENVVAAEHALASSELVVSNMRLAVTEAQAAAALTVIRLEKAAAL